jgi:biopolymer transport protein ExbB
MPGIVERWGQYLDEGGFVMPYLALAAALLWFALGYRWLTLRRGSRHGVRRIVEGLRSGKAGATGGIICEAASRAVEVATSGPRHLRRALDDALGDYVDQMRRFSTLAKAIVMVAPLAGLLGTVAGMIETFEALGDMSLFSQSGGIAGGISQALISTQMGLAVAIPGLLIGRILARRQEALQDELEQIKDVLCGDSTVAMAASAGG